MIERRRFLLATGAVALSPFAGPLVKALPAQPPAQALLASNALALLRG